MLDIKFIRENPGFVKEGVSQKGIDPKIVDEFLALDEKWRKHRKEADVLLKEQKRFSEMRDIEAARRNKEKLKAEEVILKEIEVERFSILRKIPNLPLSYAPRGRSEAENVVLREVGEKPKFDFTPKDYLSIAERLSLIDMERAAKVSGSRFGYILGDLAVLEFALGALARHILTNRKKLAEIIADAGLPLLDTPFTLVIPPVLVNERSMAGMGYLERGGDEVYRVEKDNLYLVGTSEQALGPMHQDEIFDEKDLPRRYLGFSTCFRREAGSYGKDIKGILRVHQFDKFEMFSFVRPEDSENEHKFFLAVEERLMQELKIPYRVVSICTADLGDPAGARFDIEAWMPGQNNGRGEYRETHSASNTTDYQARRLGIRYKKGKTIKFVHTVNGTAFAVGRTLIAMIENYQTADGRIRIPEVLQKYAGKEFIG